MKRILAIASIIEDAEAEHNYDLMEFVDIGPAARNPDNALLHPDIRDLCAVTNGMRCRGIDVYGVDDVLERGLSYSTRLPGGPDAWQTVADVIGLPFLLNRVDGTIWYPTVWNVHTFHEGPLQQVAPDLWSFVGWFVMGQGYLDIFSSPDEWTDFLQEHDLFGWENPE